MKKINKTQMDKKEKGVLNKKSLLRTFSTSILKISLALALFFFMVIPVATAEDIIVKSGNLNVSQDLLVDTNTLFVDSTSNKVGIGTTGPEVYFVVYRDNSEEDINGSVLQIEQDGTGDAILTWLLTVTRRWYSGIDNSDSDKWKLATTSGTPNFDTDALLTVQTDGKVGIGQTSPDGKLHIHGPDGSDDPNLFIESGSPEMTFETGNTKYNWRIAMQEDVDQGFEIASGGTDADATDDTWTNRFVINGPSGNIGIGTTTPSYPLEVAGSASGISIYSEADISATDYITRTSVFDKSKDAWDYIKDADYYLTNEEIEHNKFYGYVTYKNKDKSRPVIVQRNETYFDETLNTTVTTFYNETTYPYLIDEEGVSLSKEIDVLRQAVYELKEELCKKDASYQWCS